MCDPMTIATVGISAAGTMYGAVQQSQAANANAKVLRNQQIARKNQAEFDTNRAIDTRNRVISSQVAGYNASGVSLEGSPLEVMGDTTAESALDIAAIQYNSEVDINNLESRRLQQKAQGSNAIVAGAIGSLSAGLNTYNKSQRPSTVLKGPFSGGGA